MAADDAKTSENATIGQRLDQAIDATREKFGNVTAEAKERLAKGKEALGEYREKGKETLSELREKGKETLTDLRQKNMDDVVTTVKAFAKEHPGTTLLGGLAVGFLVGFLFRSRD